MLIICISIIFKSTTIANELLLLQKLEGTIVKYGPDSSMKIGVAKLLYCDKSGDFMPTNERYIIIYSDDAYPIIGSIILGHTVSLKIEDVDGDGELELLSYYFAGGNQYVLELFEISEEKLFPFRNQPGSSNMRSIEIINKKIIVKNNVFTENGERKVEEDIYNIKNGYCEKVK